MKNSFASILLLAATASAAAVARGPQPRHLNAHMVLRRATPAGLCPGIDSPVCCETDVDGVVDLTCEQPSPIPKSTEEFSKICASTGLTAECCLLDVDGDGLVCTSQG